MGRALSAETVAIVKATGPALQRYGTAISTRMYERLFIYAEARDLFDMAAQHSGEQPRRMAAAILSYAQNIDEMENLTGVVRRMVASHVGAGVEARHYPYVAEAFLPAIRDVLGEEVATRAVLDAWGEAYWFLADLLIEGEAARYAELPGDEGGFERV